MQVLYSQEEEHTRQAGMLYNQEEDYNEKAGVSSSQEQDCSEQARMLVCSQEEDYSEQAGMFVTHTKGAAPGIVRLPSTRGEIRKTGDAASGRSRPTETGNGD